jgi:tetratricopeptide (TPR) repeat protein
MRSLVLAMSAALALGAGTPQQADPLVRARQLYNARQFDQAITAANEARKVPKTADAAAVVLARALLERHRQSTSPEDDDLATARDALKQADVTKLSARDRVEHAIGLGESLYFEGHYSAAAETFELALSSRDGPDGEARDRLFEWWAGSLDQQAQFGPDADRRPLYARILERAGLELALNDRSAVATYWLAAAARGADDIGRAWGAAISGWIRAASMPDRGAALRADLDRLVTQVILPERARRLSPNDPLSAMAGLRQEWEKIKKDWE